MLVKIWILREPDKGDGGAGGTPDPTANADAKPNADAKTFTQVDVDKIVGDRAKRAGESAVNGLLESLGVKNADELKSALEQLKKLDDANKSELEKAQKHATEWQAKAEKAKADADATLTLANERLLKSAVMLEAQKANVEDSEVGSVWLVLANDKTLREKITQAENGDFENVADAVKEIVKQHPKWVKQTETKPRANGTPPARNQGRQGGTESGNARPIFSGGEF